MENVGRIKMLGEQSLQRRGNAGEKAVQFEIIQAGQVIYSRQETA